MEKILLYYHFRPVADPEAVRLWQRTLCEKLGLRGRIIVSPQGINGTVGGTLDACKAYVRATREYAPFRELEVKWSDGGAEDFPRLSVKVRDELVAFGAPGEVVVDEHGVVGGGVHLKPEQVDALADEREDLVFFDGRNAFEAQVGRFEGAVVPRVEHSRDFVAELESGRYDHLKDRPVVAYCTGGIRCEVLTVLMKNRGFREVYQIDGGIVKYGERFGDDSRWKGHLYVFDRRMTVPFSDHAETIGRCAVSGRPTTNFVNVDRLPQELADELGLDRSRKGQVLIHPDVLAEYAQRTEPANS